MTETKATYGAVPGFRLGDPVCWRQQERFAGTFLAYVNRQRTRVRVQMPGGFVWESPSGAWTRCAARPQACAEGDQR